MPSPVLLHATEKVFRSLGVNNWMECERSPPKLRRSSAELYEVHGFSAASPVAMTSESKASEAALPQALIPGLPDDLALECMVRVPREHHFRMRFVSSGWRSLMLGDHFYKTRMRLGLTEDWIYVLSYSCNGKQKNTWQAYDPRVGRWHKLPDMPEAYTQAFGLRAAVLRNMLFVFGGQEGIAKKQVADLYKYDPRTNRWMMGARMRNSRSDFASAVLNDSLYVAGGFGADRRMLNSAEVYNPSEDTWHTIEPMGKPMALCHGLAVRNCFYVRDQCLPACAPGPVSVNVYDTKTKKWRDVEKSTIMSGWRGATAVVDGRLYVTNRYDGFRIKVYEVERDRWIEAPGLDRLSLSTYSDKQKPPFKLTGFGGKLVAAGRGPTLTIVDVRKAMMGRREGAAAGGGGGGRANEGNNEGESGRALDDAGDETALWRTVGGCPDVATTGEQWIDIVVSVQVIGL